MMHLVLLPVVLLLYFLPILIASFRKVVRTGGLIVFNVLLGWTGLGWLIALIWACTAETRDQAFYREVAVRSLTQQPAPSVPVSRPAPQGPAALYYVARFLGGLVRKGRRGRAFEPPPSIR